MRGRGREGGREGEGGRVISHLSRGPTLFLSLLAVSVDPQFDCCLSLCHPQLVASGAIHKMYMYMYINNCLFLQLLYNSPLHDCPSVSSKEQYALCNYFILLCCCTIASVAFEVSLESF